MVRFNQYMQQIYVNLKIYEGVQPDKEIHDIMVSRFGAYNYSTLKAKRMLYWLPKLKHLNKYLDRRKVEHQNLTDVEIAKLALKMICRDLGTQISFLKVLISSVLSYTNL